MSHRPVNVRRRFCKKNSGSSPRRHVWACMYEQEIDTQARAQVSSGKRVNCRCLRCLPSPLEARKPVASSIHRGRRGRQNHIGLNASKDRATRFRFHSAISGISPDVLETRHGLEIATMLRPSGTIMPTRVRRRFCNMGMLRA